MNDNKVVTRSQKGVQLYPLLEHHRVSSRPISRRIMADNEDLVNALVALTASIRLQNDNHADATLHHTHRQNALENLLARLAANTRTDVERIPRFSGSIKLMEWLLMRIGMMMKRDFWPFDDCQEQLSTGTDERVMNMMRGMNGRTVCGAPSSNDFLSQNGVF